MALFGFSDALNAAYAALSDGQKEAFDEEADSSCTGGSDTDGSSVFEIFENGYELGRSAGEADVFANHEADAGIYFYVDSEESLLKRLQEALERGDDDGV